MKQFALLCVLLVFGVGGSFLWTPAAGVAMYYLFGVLRPQYLWQFQMTGYPGITWSFFLAASAIGSYLLWSIGLLSYGQSERTINRYSPAFTKAHAAMMLFALWVSLSYVFSNYREISEEWFGEYIKIFVMYFVAMRVIRTSNQVYALYMIVTCCIAYIAFDENTVYVQNGGVVRFYKRGFARLDNNGVGLLMAMAMPLCYFAWEMTRGWYRWLFLFGLISIVHAVMITYSRGAMASMILGGLVMFLYTRKKKMYLIFVGIMLVLVSIMAGKEIVARFTSIEKRESDLSWQSRQTSWAIAAEIATDYPIFGAGIRCSAPEMFARGADMEGRTIHSQYLQIAADSGWLAMLVYLAAVGTTFVCIWQARRRLWHRTDPEGVRGRCMLGGVECSLIVFFIGAGALSLEVFEPPYLLMLIGTQIYALIHATDTARPELENLRVLKRRTVRVPILTPRGAAPRWEPQPAEGPPSTTSVLAPPSFPRLPFDPFQRPKPPRRGGRR
jgi:probable O-glycosylation ligase (exosortase A-associated)